MSKLKFRLLLAALLLFASPAFAQSVTVVSDCNTGISPALQTGPSGPGTIAVDTAGRQCNSPGNTTQITGNATGTTGAVVGTLAAASGKKTFICGFAVSATGGTAAVGPVTVAGLVGSSMVYQLFSTATGANLAQQFSPCIPSSAVNTAITVTTTADGTATAVDVNSWGYQQ